MAFVPVAGHVVNVTRDGTAVAIFPLDDLAWTEHPPAHVPRGEPPSFAASSPAGVAVFATTGLVTPLAAAEIKKLGWKIVQLK